MQALETESKPAEPVVIDHLSVKYGRQVVLDDISMTLHRGSFVGVLGPNGAGKSTLLKAILGIAPAFLGDVSVFQESAVAGRHRIAYVPQTETLRWDFPVSALDVVLMGRYRQRGWLRPLSKEDRNAADDALEQVGMKDRQQTPIGELSGGQRQRVFVARALAQRAEIMLLDEPLNGIDLPTRELILQIIGRLQATGKTVVMATHDLVSASQVCDCFCCINRCLIAHGPAAETLRADVLERTYGGALLVLDRQETRYEAAGHVATESPRT